MSSVVDCGGLDGGSVDFVSSGAGVDDDRVSGLDGSMGEMNECDSSSGTGAWSGRKEVRERDGPE